MLKIISANVNGIRSAYKKGFYEYIAASGADIVCVQELKAQEADLSADMKNPHGMHGHWHCAEKRGYSGVAVYSKRKPDNVQIGMGIEEFDREGRFVRCDFGRLSVISLYLPSGSSAEERQQVKYRFLDAFYPMLEAMKNEGRDIVVCGDWNIAHQNIDLKNWKGNQKNSGFLPEEREWIGKVIHKLGWTDMWRTLYPDVPGYTWWSNRGQAYAKDVGWRIDYQMVTPELAAKAVSAHVYKDENFLTMRRWSWSMTMLPNKVLGKYDWNVDGKTGIGAAWVVAAFILPMLVWAIFMLSRMQGWLAPTKANPIWALVWLLICLPCLLIASKCLGWKGWRLLANVLACLAVRTLLSVPAALLIAFTLQDLLK